MAVEIDGHSYCISNFKIPFIIVVLRCVYYTNIIYAIIYYFIYILFKTPQSSMSYILAVLHPCEVYLFYSGIYLRHGGGNI